MNRVNIKSIVIDMVFNGETTRVVAKKSRTIVGEAKIYIRSPDIIYIM